MAKFDDKISSIINAQLPEFVVADHPKFAEFLKVYYSFMESAEIKVESVESTDGILLETETNQINLLILDGGRLGSTRTQLDNGDKVLQESTTYGKFTSGEIIKGESSNATATILTEDLDNNSRLFISSQNKFINGEKIVGQTSNATAIIKDYKPNPVQNISELVSFRDPDNVISNFLTNFRNEFLATLPESLATGVNKRSLIKNIKSLYRLKGTAEGHRIFFSLLFNQISETKYPRDNLLRVSDGQFGTRTIVRAIDVTGDTSKLIGRTITGETSNASAVVENVFKYGFTDKAVSEFVINKETLSGTFQIGEIIQGTESDTNDVFIKSTITGIPGQKTITNDGALYDTTATIKLTGGGNSALFAVDTLGSGSLTELIIDDGGFDFDIGDKLVFNNTGTQGSGASAFVSVVNGGFGPEQGVFNGNTLFPENANSANPLTKYLEGPVISVQPNSVTGSGNTIATIRGTQNDIDDGTSTAVLLIVGQSSGATATVRYNVNGTTLGPEDFNDSVLYITYTGTKTFIKGEVVTATKQNSTTFNFRLRDGFGRENVGISAAGIDETNIADRDSIYQMQRRLGGVTDEEDHIVLEDETGKGDSYSGNKIVQEKNTGVSDITDLFLINGGGAYKSLPTISFTNTDGTSTSSGKDFKIKCFGTEIGRILTIKTIEHGIEHELSPTPPSIEFVNNSIVKTATGNFGDDEVVTGNTSGFTGKVITYDSPRGLLKIKDVVGSPQVGETITGGTSGVTAKLHKTDHASASVSVSAMVDTDGSYQNEDGHLSEDTMRVQDSLYYQDFSYVIKVGESIDTWRNSFKKTMHTGGFYFTGEVAIANRISAKVKAPVVGEVSGVSESPLFSILNTLFTTIFRRKHGTLTDGTTLRPNAHTDFDFSSRPSSSTRDLTVRSSAAITNIVSRVRRTVAGVNIAQGFAYAGPRYHTLNKYHNTAFRGSNRANGSGITFAELSNIKIFGTRSSLDGQGAIFKLTSDVNGRMVKSNFSIPADITTSSNRFSNTLIKFDNTTPTFDDTTP